MTGFIVFMSFMVVVFFFWGIRIIRPTHRGVVERLGKYKRYVEPGFCWIIPIIETIRMRNITERMTNVAPQDIITKDNLNARVDLVVYHKVKSMEEEIKKSYYNVEDYKTQIIMLAQTTARNVIGAMRFIDVNNQRNILNAELAIAITKEIESWGVEVVRVELKEITPPQDVQETMNRVIKAQNEKEAAVDFATAAETKADGERRAEIKKAEGVKQARVLEAEGEAQAIKSVNEAANQYFVGNAQILKKLETVEKALSNNAKVVVPSNTELINVIGELAGVVPINKGK